MKVQTTNKETQMKRNSSLLQVVIMFLIFLTNVCLSQTTGGDLFELAKIKSDVQTKRVSSYDRTGGNNDRFEHIKAGEKRIIFDVKGAGMINHIWITIAPPPEKLNRNDIVLRMYDPVDLLPF